MGDITYIGTDEGWLYLAVVMDVYSRRIVGWSMGEGMPASLVSAGAVNRLNQKVYARIEAWRSEAIAPVRVPGRDRAQAHLGGRGAQRVGAGGDRRGRIRQSREPVSRVSRNNPPPSASLPGLDAFTAATVNLPASAAMPIPPLFAVRYLLQGQVPPTVPPQCAGCNGTAGNARQQKTRLNGGFQGFRESLRDCLKPLHGAQEGTRTPTT